MWKEYSLNYLKNNRASCLSIRLCAFISALLLSLLCGLFYNTWKYEVERIRLDEGDWHSRLVGCLDQEDIENIKNFATVKDVVINDKESRSHSDQEITADLYFDDLRVVLSDTPRLAALANIPQNGVFYNHALLAMYLIRDPRDTAPRLLFPMFILITLLASVSLIVVVHNAFTVSMNARIHRLGILSSVGATPKQLLTCLLQEAAALCTAPVLGGNLIGIAGCMGFTALSNVLASDFQNRRKAVPGYHPLVFALTFLVTAATIGISAWLPARKLSRLTPLEAIKNTGEPYLKRKRKSPILAFMFGVEGELAGNALKAQRKALRTASLSLILSFMAFTIMQCFFATSEISTRETYFERYQNAWDIMVTVKDADVDTFELTEECRNLSGVRDAVIYQKAAAKRIIAEEEMTDEMKACGGFSLAPEKYVNKADGGWLINTPVIILDDYGFLAYCEQLGIAPQLDGAVILNQIRDVTNPDFRHPVFMPYIRNTAESILRQSGMEEQTARIPVLSCTEKTPVLREEYATLDYYELVHFLPASLWGKIKNQIAGSEDDIHIRILCRENATLEELNGVQNQINRLVGQSYTVTSENRIQEYETNDKKIQGMKVVLGSFCVLLAVIGIGNVFSNTFGFVRQRKREFARYMSVGLTPGELGKMFCIEALVIAGKPILITFFPAVLTVLLMLKMSYLTMGEFLAEAPFTPIAIFMLVILVSVALAYFYAWRSVQKINLAEILKDDAS